MVVWWEKGDSCKALNLLSIYSQLLGGPTIGWVVRALNESGKGDCGVESIVAAKINGKGQPYRVRDDIATKEIEADYRPRAELHLIYPHDWHSVAGPATKAAAFLHYH